ncbi:unnamed protein product [Miscanthus lutarioriparius]|uniref:Uncharacterized protein n=1 Tax=Miscanthus lutarioriparius TaxID=422564 RepID=A0A811MMP1_9POAL|nr:unnamed protein product [Miscanthus lutarioriparius]
MLMLRRTALHVVLHDHPHLLLHHHGWSSPRFLLPPAPPYHPSSLQVLEPEPESSSLRNYCCSHVHLASDNAGLQIQKQRPRAARTSELQAQLTLVQEDLRNARDHLASIENDRAQILEDLAVANRLAADANGKLEDSLLAQRRAEEALELERFKSTEREQSAMDLAQRTEDEWRRKYDSVRKRHAEDVASLIATARELEAAKDSALNQADELQGIASRSEKKAEVLTAEVARLKSRLDTELENKAKEAAETIERLESEASALRAELRKAKEFEEKLAKAEQAVEGLKVDVAYARRVEADASRSAQEWKSKAGSLETRLEAASHLNKRNEESLASLTNSLEDCTSMLQDKQSQLLQLEDKVAALEKEASERLEVATEESCELHAAIDGLRSEHQLLHEAHQQAVGAEKTASAQVGHLTEDKNKLLRELADTREKRDKVKKAVEDLAAALREVSSEAREAKERVLAKQAELDDARLQMSELKAAMKNAEERYQLRMVSEAKISKDDWVSKEAGFVDLLKRSDDGISSIQLEMNRLTESLRAADNEVQELRADKTQLLKRSASEKASEVSKLLGEMTARKAEVESTDKSKALQAKLDMDEVLESLKAAEGEAKAAKEEKVQLQNKLRLLESKITEANLTSEEAKISSLRLKETLEDKEHELASIVQENREMQAREAAAHAKINELALLLAEATARNGGELSKDDWTEG